MLDAIALYAAAVINTALAGVLWVCVGGMLLVGCGIQLCSSLGYTVAQWLFTRAYGLCKFADKIFFGSADTVVLPPEVHPQFTATPAAAATAQPDVDDIISGAVFTQTLVQEVDANGDHFNLEVIRESIARWLNTPAAVIYAADPRAGASRVTSSGLTHEHVDAITAADLHIHTSPPAAVSESATVPVPAVRADYPDIRAVVTSQQTLRDFLNAPMAESFIVDSITAEPLPVKHRYQRSLLLYTENEESSDATSSDAGESQPQAGGV